MVEKPAFPQYQTESAEVSSGKEAVQVQQATEDGFLVLINRMVRDETPEELLEDPDFVNDGRYAVYENALFLVNRSGKRTQISGYTPLPAPENPEELEEYFSESMPGVFRLTEDGSILALESSFESWQDEKSTPRYQTRDRYTLRLLEEDGSEQFNCPMAFEVSDSGPDLEQAVFLTGGFLAIPQGEAVLIFDQEGNRLFTVETPFPVSELCPAGGGNLAVILKEGENAWISVIDPGDRSVTVPVEVPADAHDFCASAEEGSVCFLRRSEIFTADAATGEISKLVSLLALGVNPSEVGAFSVDRAGTVSLFVNSWDPDAEDVKIRLVTATPAAEGSTENVESPADEVGSVPTVLTLGFLSMTDRLEEALIRFNDSQSVVRIEPVDYGNLSEDALIHDDPDLVIMDSALYGRLAGERKLADLSALLSTDGKSGETVLLPSVLHALREDDGSLRCLAGVFRIESVVCDGEAVGGRTSLSLDELWEILREMPAGSSLYEPYYTSDRLLEALAEVNRRELVAGGQHNGALYAKLQTFAGMQPEQYDYTDYILDRSGTERRMDEGRLLMMQAHIGTLEEFKRYDAFFYGEACFAGWPTEDASRSMLRFDELIGISEHCTPGERAAAWKFVRCVLEESYSSGSYGFSTVQKHLEKHLDEDASAISYRLDKDGDFELDKKGEKIEQPRSVWYSPEGNRHYEYALTEMQREKLMQLIGNSV